MAVEKVCKLYWLEARRSGSILTPRNVTVLFAVSCVLFSLLIGDTECKALLVSSRHRGELKSIYVFCRFCLFSILSAYLLASVVVVIIIYYFNFPV